MLSESRHTSRSPSESVKTESVITVPTTRLTSQRSQRSSISEEDENESVIPPPPPLNPFLASAGTNAKSRSRSSKTSSTSSSSTPKPSAGAGFSLARATNALGAQRSEPRRYNSDQKNGSSSKKSAKPNAFQKAFLRGSSNEKSTARFAPQKDNSKLSVFEKVDRHNGHATYLGSGTFSQLENCIRNCLSQERSYGKLHDYSAPSSSHHPSLKRASVLEDYSYEGIKAPHEQINISTDHHHLPHEQHHRIKHAAELPLDEIRQVNDALAKYGIPVFSHLDQSHHFPHRPPPIGEILSSCQQLLADPLLQSQRGNAVRHVWDNLHAHSPQTNIHGYASPAVRGAASHLFGGPNQSPYDPVHGAASHLFHQPPQNSFYSPPPPPPGPYGGGPPQNFHNPPPPYSSGPYGGGPPQNFHNSPPPPSSGPYGGGSPQNFYNSPPPPPPPGPPGAGQSVLSRLFGGR